MWHRCAGSFYLKFKFRFLFVSPEKCCHREATWETAGNKRFLFRNHQVSLYDEYIPRIEKCPIQKAAVVVVTHKVSRNALPRAGLGRHLVSHCDPVSGIVEVQEDNIKHQGSLSWDVTAWGEKKMTKKLNSLFFWAQVAIPKLSANQITIMWCEDESTGALVIMFVLVNDRVWVSGFSYP